MAKFSRIELFSKMKSTFIVPVFYNDDLSVTLDVIHTMYKAGIRVFEFTNRSDTAFELFSKLVKVVRKNYPDLALGIGSIVDEYSAAIYIQSGADFIVSPIFNPSIGKVCNRRKIAWFPGCTTASEVSNAHELGVEVVKVFPANAIQIKNFIKGVKAPMPWTEIMPTGGITPSIEEMQEWLELGVTCVGIGDKLLEKKVDGSYDLQKTIYQLEVLMEYVKGHRQQELLAV